MVHLDRPGRRPNRRLQALITAAGAIEAVPGCYPVTVLTGDAIEIETPGGGGFGAASRPPIVA